MFSNNSDLRAQVEILKIRNNELMFIQDVSTQHLSNMLAIAGRALAEKEKTDKLLAETVANSEVQFKLSTKDRQFIGEMQKTLNVSQVFLICFIIRFLIYMLIKYQLLVCKL